MTCDGCGSKLRPTDYPYTVCLPCTSARARSFARRGVCVCKRRERRETEVMGIKGQRQWVACHRCLGTVRQVA
jgi:hypothetical protein